MQNDDFRTYDINDRIRGTLGTRRGENYGKEPKGRKSSDQVIKQNEKGKDVHKR